MTADERKQYLQSIGALPPDEDGLMPFPSEVPQEQSTENPSIGQALGNAGRTYAKAYGVDVPEPPANSDDPKEKLKKLMTPELMQRLRERAGVTGA